jgi:hypothetical protein
MPIEQLVGPRLWLGGLDRTVGQHGGIPPPPGTTMPLGSPQGVCVLAIECSGRNDRLLGPAGLSQQVAHLIPPPWDSGSQRREVDARWPFEPRHLPDTTAGVVPLAGGRVTAGHCFERRSPVWSKRQRARCGQQGAFGVTRKELRRCQQIEPRKVLWIVRAES